MSTSGNAEPAAVAEGDTGGTPRLLSGAEPRGLTGQGLVRTTGWLQFGTEPISSGLITTTICLLLSLVTAITLLSSHPVISGLAIYLLPTGGYGLWHLITTRLVPASTAHNIDLVAAGELETGNWIRLYGTIGPVAQVARVQPRRVVTPSGEESIESVEVTFIGGAGMTWSAGHRLHVVDVHD